MKRDVFGTMARKIRREFDAGKFRARLLILRIKGSRERERERERERKRESARKAPAWRIWKDNYE